MLGLWSGHDRSHVSADHGPQGLQRLWHTAYAQRSVLVFLVVGASVTGLHFCAVVALVSALGLTPLLANVLAWFVSFTCSLFGHWRFSFGHQNAPLGQAAKRFFAVALIGLGLNQSAYALMLKYSGWGYMPALAVVLLGVACITYTLSRWWAFKSPQHGVAS